MPNHFHFLVKQLKENGIAKFLSHISNSYTKYFNLKYNHSGAHLQGVFKSVRVETDEQLMHLSRYIHLNPIVSGIIKNLENYYWSSYLEFLSENNYFCSPKVVLDLFSTKDKYQEFVEEQIDYGKTLEILKHQTIDEH